MDPAVVAVALPTVGVGLISVFVQETKMNHQDSAPDHTVGRLLKFFSFAFFVLFVVKKNIEPSSRGGVAICHSTS